MPVANSGETENDHAADGKDAVEGFPFVEAGDQAQDERDRHHDDKGDSRQDQGIAQSRKEQIRNGPSCA